MSVSGFIADIASMADDANKAARYLLNRDISGMGDCDWLTRAFVARSRAAGLQPDDAFDARLAWQSCAAAVWKGCGGPRFCPSDSVAASFVLTKQQTQRIHLPFPMQMLQLPKGFMPSPIVGSFDGAMIFGRLPNDVIYVVSHVVRPSNTGTRVMFFTDDVDEAETKTLLNPSTNRPVDGMMVMNPSTTAGLMPTSQESSEAAVAMTIRIIRNFASWMSAFPARTGDRRASVQPKEIGASVKVGDLVYLKTEVQLDAEMRQAASEVIAQNGDYKTRKLAMRHIVRGHWRQQVIKGGHKTIWISPFWRGPDGPSAWGRVYRMQGAS